MKSQPKAATVAVMPVCQASVSEKSAGPASTGAGDRLFEAGGNVLARHDGESDRNNRCDKRAAGAGRAAGGAGDRVRAS